MTSYHTPGARTVLLISLFLLLAISPSCGFSVVSYTPADSPSVRAGQSLLFNFTLSSGLGESIQALWYVNNTPLATGLSYSFTAAQGSYNVTAFISNNSMIYSHSWIASVTVSNTAPLIQPIGTITLAEGQQVSFQVNVSDAENDPIMLSLSSLPSGASFSQSSFLWAPAIGQQGTYQLTVYASDGQSVVSMPFTLQVTQVSFNLSLLSPSGMATSKYVQLSANSDRNASCRYSTSLLSFGDMSTFQSSNGTYHVSSITLSEGFTQLLLRCRDNTGLEVSRSYSLETRLPPEASITLIPATPLKDGLITVVVESSKPLKAAPSLMYAYDDSATDRRTISLEMGPTPSEWKGHLIVAPGTGMRPGSFTFYGEDLNGVAGSTIRQGKTFIVDTEMPPGVDSLRTTGENDSIKLQWHYAAESLVAFRIYRSATTGVDYTDYYTSCNGSSFIDHSVDSGVRYYYRISPVDLAGNEGSLSPEISGVAIEGAEPAPRAELSIDSRLKTNATIRSLDRLAVDVQAALSKLDTSSAPKSIISALGLREPAVSAKSDIEDLSNQLKSAVASQDQSAVERLLNMAELRQKSIEMSVPRGISNIDSSQFVYYTDADSIKDALEAMPEYGKLSSGDQSRAHEASKAANGLTRVKVTLISADITYLDDHSSSKSLVTKDVTYDSPEQLVNPKIVESIPKTAAQSASDVLLQPTGITLQQDPVFALSPGQLSATAYEYNLTFSSRISADTAKQLKTVIVPQFPKPQPAGTTGFLAAVPSLIGQKLAVQNLLFIAGIVVVLLMSGYYMRLRAKPRRLHYAHQEPSHPKRELSEKEYFYFANSQVARDIHGLVAALETMPDSTFRQHVNPTKNDICSWLTGVYGLVALSASLSKASSRQDYIAILRKFLSER